MKLRARVALLLLASSLSSATIVAWAAKSEPPTKDQIEKLMKFEATFTEKMNEVIRNRMKEGTAQSTMIAERCFAMVMIDRAVQLFDMAKAKVPVKNLCTLTAPQNRELRDLVMRRMDEIYQGKGKPDELEALLKAGTAGSDFFSHRIYPPEQAKR